MKCGSSLIVAIAVCLVLSIPAQSATPHAFPKGSVNVAHGSLHPVFSNDGQIVAHRVTLDGTPEQRGFAHGQLLAAQIIDVLNFYVIGTNLAGDVDKYNAFTKFLRAEANFTKDDKAELDAIIKGMEASSASLIVPYLNRTVDVFDVLAINAYLEIKAQKPGPYTGHHIGRAPACTQLVAWDSATVHTDIDGGLITGRNMDGECDDEKVTVTHLIIFAITPNVGHRFVSVLWPGHIGTLSAFNEHGVYAMLNCGSMGPSPVVGGFTPISISMRQVLMSLDAEQATPDAVVGVLESKFRSTGGGVSAAGSNIMFARPATKTTRAEGFVYECDRNGGTVRSAMMVAPLVNDTVMATNHFMVRGVHDVGDAPPKDLFGMNVASADFSSAWRYQAGQASVEAWSRERQMQKKRKCQSSTATSVSACDRDDGDDGVIGTERVREFLRRVSHGFTEHSVIWKPNQRKFEIANADGTVGSDWDAPYMTWTELSFEDMFSTAAQVQDDL